jgi:hypothetical protein
VGWNGGGSSGGGAGVVKYTGKMIIMRVDFSLETI